MLKTIRTKNKNYAHEYFVIVSAYLYNSCSSSKQLISVLLSPICRLCLALSSLLCVFILSVSKSPIQTYAYHYIRTIPDLCVHTQYALCHTHFDSNVYNSTSTFTLLSNMELSIVSFQKARSIRLINNLKLNAYFLKQISSQNKKNTGSMLNWVKMATLIHSIRNSSWKQIKGMVSIRGEFHSP